MNVRVFNQVLEKFENNSYMTSGHKTKKHKSSQPNISNLEIKDLEFQLKDDSKVNEIYLFPPRKSHSSFSKRRQIFNKIKTENQPYRFSSNKKNEIPFEVKMGGA